MFNPISGLGGTGWLAESISRLRKYGEEPAPSQAEQPDPEAPMAPPTPRNDDAVGDAVRKRLKKFLKDDGGVVEIPRVGIPNGRAFGAATTRKSARGGGLRFMNGLVPGFTSLRQIKVRPHV